MHALYATTYATPDHGPITFRVGTPTSLENAHKRHQRFDVPHYYGRRRFGIQCGSTAPLEIQWWEVREVDAHGKGLGSERHARAIPVLVHDVQTLPEGPHTLTVERNGWGAQRYTATVEAAGGIAQGTANNVMTAQSMARLNARRESLI